MKDVVDMTIGITISYFTRDIIENNINIIVITRDHFALNLGLAMNALGMMMDVLDTNETNRK